MRTIHACTILYVCDTLIHVHAGRVNFEFMNFQVDEFRVRNFELANSEFVNSDCEGQSPSGLSLWRVQWFVNFPNAVKNLRSLCYLFFVVYCT